MSDLNTAVRYSFPNVSFSEQMPELHEAVIAARTLFPDEIRPLADMGVAPSDQRAARLLRSSLENAISYGSDKQVQNAEIASRAIGMLVASHLGPTIESNEPFSFGYGTVGFDGTMVAIDEPRIVLDHGIGLNGLLSHRSHIKNDGHLVIASAEDDIQAFGLEGLAKGLVYPDDSLLVVTGAIETAELTLQEFGEKSVDLALLSHIQGMDKKSMKAVIDTTPRLLRVGGLVIVRSPEQPLRGLNAEQQVAGLLGSASMVLEGTYLLPNAGTPNGDPNPQQAYVLRKVEK